MVAAFIDQLAHIVIERSDTLKPTRRLLVGIAGIPGSGKSTLSQAVLERIVALRGPCCVLVGMDGWHYPRTVLDEMSDPAEAHKRRGAAFTFDADAFVAFAERLRQDGLHTITAPSFSHAEKDPVSDAIQIKPTHKIVLIEGLYCCLDVEPWKRAAECWDLRWFIDTTPQIARERLTRRHVESGICANAALAMERADTNDLPNGEWILAHLFEPVTHWNVPNWYEPTCE